MTKPIMLKYLLTGETVLVNDPDYVFTAGKLESDYAKSMQHILVTRLNTVTGKPEEISIPVMHLQEIREKEL